MSMGVVAGIAAIVKTVKLPLLSSGDLCKSLPIPRYRYLPSYFFSLTTHNTDDGVELVIWDITEIVVCMVAACIPVLRVLVRDVRNSTRGRSSTGRATGYGSRYGLGSQATGSRAGTHAPSWLPGWKGSSRHQGTVASVTASRLDNHNKHKHQNTSRSSRDSSGEEGNAGMNDDWSEMNIIVTAPKGESNGGFHNAGPGDIVRIQEVRVESRRESLNSRGM